jgi:hypothetical protein
MQSSTAYTALLARCGSQWLVRMWHAATLERTARSPALPADGHVAAADTAEASAPLSMTPE